uniref:SFRICE_036997 n=1 Tax=Spodoptera frugiperda TaxID=7108 RepID=A0A2H1X058_SPOFR
MNPYHGLKLVEFLVKHLHIYERAFPNGNQPPRDEACIQQYTSFIIINLFSSTAGHRLLQWHTTELDLQLYASNHYQPPCGYRYSSYLEGPLHYACLHRSTSFSRYYYDDSIVKQNKPIRGTKNVHFYALPPGDITIKCYRVRTMWKMERVGSMAQKIK